MVGCIKRLMDYCIVQGIRPVQIKRFVSETAAAVQDSQLVEYSTEYFLIKDCCGRCLGRFIYKVVRRRMKMMENTKGWTRREKSFRSQYLCFETSEEEILCDS